jgi:uncharacterized membrane protein YdjX (TVP38/TMEM64 family)
VPIRPAAALDALRRRLMRQRLKPSAQLGLWAAALFALGLVLANRYAVPIEDALAHRAVAGALLFAASSALAVLLPALSNLPLMPAAVLAFGPWSAAALLLAGWVAGSTLSFALGRHAQQWIRRRFPGIVRHADIERLIHPERRLTSLTLLRMTFPVDVLSYALGLFSRRTTLAEVALSTTLGGAPFALLFALIPVLPRGAQWVVFGASVLAFLAYLRWVPRPQAAGGRPGESEGTAPAEQTPG